MTEKLCGTCANWKRYEAGSFDSRYHGEHAGDCQSQKFVYGGTQPPIDGLRYWDYEGYSAGFNTGEKFGCVNWKERDK